MLALVDQDLFTVHVSEEAIAEYQDVLARPAIRVKNPHLTDGLAAAIVARIRSRALLHPNPPNHFQHLRDPDDEHVIDLAIESQARYLISRDKDLLDLMDEKHAEGRKFRQRFPDLTIVDLVSFLQVVAPDPGSN